MSFYCWWALSIYCHGITYNNSKFCFWVEVDSSAHAILYIRSRLIVQIHRFDFMYFESHLPLLLCNHSAAICSYLSALQPLNSFMKSANLVSLLLATLPCMHQKLRWYVHPLQAQTLNACRLLPVFLTSIIYSCQTILSRSWLCSFL